jgi:ParB-like chromosome segregation protein Spo0J
MANRVLVPLRPITQIRRYKHNPRICPQEAIDGVAASIAAFGWKVPLVVSRKGRIVTGHTRYEAALSLGLAEVPVIVADDLSKAQQRAYRIADNKTAEATSWDEDLLARELAALVGMEIDPALTGFSADELAALLAPPPTEGLCEPDEIVEPPDEPLSKPGDLWLLGAHRLLCGDATTAADVRRLMGGERAALMATDPPYLVDYTGGAHPSSAANRGAPGKDKHWDTYVDHAHSVEFYRDFLRVALDEALSGAAAIYQCYGIMRSEVIWQAWSEVGLLAHQVVVWKKTRSVLTYSWFMWDYEPVMVGWPAGHQPASRPPACERAVWEIASTIEDGATGIHATQKPVELVRRPIGWHTTLGGLLYEPFAGSGTALIAAEMTSRRCYAIELSPAFCDAAVARWERFTGKSAVLEGAS